ncbi:MAG: hypothetical protein RH859_06755 [Longimicrobiales bacterium]
MARPTPVRASLDGHAEELADLVPQERTFRHEGADWRVVVLGRGLAGPPAQGAPLLALGFCPPGSEAPDREALAVGADLETFGDADLRELAGRARPPASDAVRERPLFPGTSGDRRRGR